MAMKINKLLILFILFGSLFPYQVGDEVNMIDQNKTFDPLSDNIDLL